MHALNAAGARVSFAEIVTDKGHDAFLLEEPELFAIVRGFLDGAGKARGLRRKREMSMLTRANPNLTVANIARNAGGARVDLVLVADMVERGAKVLDVGCGDGELLRLLGESRDVDGRGIELSREGVNECVAKGLAVIQGDADTDLADYPDDAFDYVILSQTLQATRHPRMVLEHMLRIGRRAVVSFPNFGHWQVRLQLLFAGHMPQTDILPYSWYDTPNIHHCTIKDFRQLCEAIGGEDGKGGGAQCLGQPAAAESRLGGSGTCSASRPFFCSAARVELRAIAVPSLSAG